MTRLFVSGHLYVTQRIKKFFRMTKLFVSERLHASIASFVLNSSVSVLLTICTMVPVLKLQYLSFVLHCLHRSFLYGPNSAFVANG